MTHVRALFSARVVGWARRLGAEPVAALEAGLVLVALGFAAYVFGRAGLRAFAASAPSSDALWLVLRERIFLCVAIECFVVAYVAMDALLRPKDGAILLSLPLGPGPRFLAALADAVARPLPAALVLVAYAAPLLDLDGGGPILFARAALLVGLGHLLAAFAGLGFGALAGRAAASPELGGWKRFLAGGWVAADRAPLLYAPALGGGLAAFLSIPLQVSLDDWPRDPAAARIGALLVFAPALVTLGAGALAYARGFARIAPILEGADARYPLSPAAEDAEGAPYGAVLVAWTTGVAGAVAARDLASARRRHRGEPLFALALGVLGALALDRLESPVAFELGAMAVALLGARLGLRLSEDAIEVPWLRQALGLPFAALWRGKAMVTLFHALHAAFGFGAVALAVGAPWAALACLALAVVASFATPLFALGGRGALVAIPVGVALVGAASQGALRVGLPALFVVLVLAFVVSSSRRAQVVA